MSQEFGSGLGFGFGICLEVRQRKQQKGDSAHRIFIFLISSIWIQVEDNQISITDPADTGGSKREPKAFSYDFAYNSSSSQEGVHLDLGAPIVEKALQGYNGESRPPPPKHSEVRGC